MSLRSLDRYVRSMRDDLASLEVPQDIADRFGQHRDQPVNFVREVLEAEPEPYQAEILEAAAARPRVAWRAAHGVGKTTTLAWIMLWWLLTRPFSRVLVLAPAFERQVGRYLLPEAKKWVRAAPEPLPLAVRANSVEVVGYEREWFALGIQASDASMVEGGHAESLCVLADEAKGLDAEVVAALHGTQTDVGGDRLYFLASVPGGPSGPFYDTFRKGGELWRLFHTSAKDSKLVSPVWIEERAAEWGAGSPLYLARVLGEFPQEDEGTLFRLSDLEAAVERPLMEDKDAAVRFGVDVARFGADRSALAAWRGGKLLGIETQDGADTMAVAAWVASWIHRLKPERVAVDEIGIGAGVIDRLHQMGFREAVGVNVGARAEKPALFFNRRSEIFWTFRDALESEEISLPTAPELLAELSAFRFEYTASGQIKLEPKEQTRKRAGRSPDNADAMAIGYEAKAPAHIPFVV